MEQYRALHAFKRVWMAEFVICASVALADGPSVDSSKDVLIPTVYESGHFYATPVLTSGKPMRMMLDTGGGSAPSYWINKSEADSLSLVADDSCEMDGQVFQLAHPGFRNHQGIPSFPGPCNGLVILPSADDAKAEGQLVPFYFTHGVWTFDYSAKQVILRAGSWAAPAGAHKTTLGFRRTTDVLLGWPRVVLTVDGQALNMLVDTGATSHPTVAALKVSGISTTAGIGVTSYITKSTLDAWRIKHPDWLVVERGDDLFPKRTFAVIRVPKVEIAQWEIGPVWFTERPDAAFHEMMAMLMDGEPDGAVGANIFDHFQMTIDYPRQVAWFVCESDCKSTRR